MKMKALGVACLAAVVVGTSATGAWAAASPLFLLHGGRILSPGSSVAVADGTPTIRGKRTTCFGFAEGSLTSNAKPTDSLTFTTGQDTCLPSGDTSSHGGRVKQVTITSSGRLKLTYGPMLVLEVRENEPTSTCVWDISKLEGTVSIPGEIKALVTGVAKRGSGSDATCPKTAPVEQELERIESGEEDVDAETYS